jgi:hypothetical protein
LRAPSWNTEQCVGIAPWVHGGLVEKFGKDAIDPDFEKSLLAKLEAHHK